ncbi:MAG: hypothetical protein WCD45_04040 [Gallionella sp.]
MFKSVDQAMRRMFEILNSEIISISSVSRMGGSDHGGMNPRDWHAQASLMMSLIDRTLDTNEKAFIYANYGYELRGGRQERAVADTLVQAVMGAMPTGMYSRRGVEKLIRLHFGQKIGMAAVRADFKCSDRTAYEYRHRIGNALELIGKRADASLETAFEDAGIVIAEKKVYPPKIMHRGLTLDQWTGIICCDYGKDRIEGADALVAFLKKNQ